MQGTRRAPGSHLAGGAGLIPIRLLDSDPSSAVVSPVSGDYTITMQHVHFRYQDAEPDVLNDIRI